MERSYLEEVYNHLTMYSSFSLQLLRHISFYVLYKFYFTFVFCIREYTHSKKKNDFCSFIWFWAHTWKCSGKAFRSVLKGPSNDRDQTVTSLNAKHALQSIAFSLLVLQISTCEKNNTKHLLRTFFLFYRRK